MLNWLLFVHLPKLFKTFPAALGQVVSVDNSLPECCWTVSRLFVTQNSVQSDSLHYCEPSSFCQIQFLSLVSVARRGFIVFFSKDLVVLDTFIDPSFMENLAWVIRVKAEIYSRLDLYCARLVEFGANSSMASDGGFNTVWGATLCFGDIKH